MSDIPAYSDDARSVIALFYQGYVAATFFVEDDDHESVYERILLKLLPMAKSFAVVCLGGKSKAIAHAKEPRPEGMQHIYLLDKDYDDLLGELVDIPDVFYLRAYSIENYLVDFRAITAVAVEMNARELTMAKALTRCADFPAYYDKLCLNLKELARIFVVARRNRVSTQTTKMQVSEILTGSDQDRPIPTDEWVAQFKLRVQSKAYGANEWLADDTAFQVALESAFHVSASIRFPTVEPEAHICGKHLLGCVLRYLQNALGVKLATLDPVELYLRIVAHSSLQELFFLREQLSDRYPKLVRI